MLGFLILIAWAAGLIVVVGSVLLIRGMQRPPRRTAGVALAYNRPTDPGDLGLAGREVVFTFEDGTRSPGWVIDGGKPDGPIVVITHGFGVSRFWSLDWVPLMRPFASHVVVYDLRAHGDSTAKRAWGGADQYEVRDLMSVMDQSPDHCNAGPGTRFLLVGLSMGAGVSLSAGALDDRDRVAGVIADGPFRHRTEPVGGVLWAKRYPVYPFVWIAGLYFALMLGGPWGYDRVGRARRLGCPLLVLHGTDDPLCRYASGRAIAEAAPRGEFVGFEGAGHLDLIDRDPERYYDAVAAFVARLDPNDHRQGVGR